MGSSPTGHPKWMIDPVFTSHFWQEFFKYAGKSLCMSSANDPQTDGQTERVNQCLEIFLRCFTQACPKSWRFWIPLAHYWYNSSHHSAIGMSPFRVMYGHEPHHWGITPTNATVKTARISRWSSRQTRNDHFVPSTSVIRNFSNCNSMCRR